MQYIVFCNKTFRGGGGRREGGRGRGRERGRRGVGGRERLVWASGETRDGTPVYTHMQMCYLYIYQYGRYLKVFSHWRTERQDWIRVSKAYIP
jgi:hypothetical protein